MDERNNSEQHSVLFTTRGDVSAPAFQILELSSRRGLNKPITLSSAKQAEAPVEQLAGVAAFSRWKREKEARRAERKAQWLACEKADDSAIWVDYTQPGLETAGSASDADLHLKNFNLPNKKGVGDLLVDATWTITRGRRSKQPCYVLHTICIVFEC